MESNEEPFFSEHNNMFYIPLNPFFRVLFGFKVNFILFLLLIKAEIGFSLSIIGLALKRPVIHRTHCDESLGDE